MNRRMKFHKTGALIQEQNKGQVFLCISAVKLNHTFPNYVHWESINIIQLNLHSFFFFLYKKSICTHFLCL